MVDSDPINGEAATNLPSRKSSFASDAIKLATGLGVAQAIRLLAAPIIARLYSPDDLGLLTLFLSIISIISVVACLRYEQAILLPKDNHQASNLFAVSLLSTVAISILIVPIVLFVGPYFTSLINAPDLLPYLVLVPPAVLFGGIYLALNYWTSREKKFGRLSTNRVINSVVGTGTQVGAGAAGLANAGSLIGAFVLGSFVSTSVLGGQTLRDDWSLLRKNIHRKDMLLSMIRYKKFPLFGIWSALLNSLSWQLPAFLLSAFFSTSVVGFYGMANRLLRIPMNFIGNSIAQVFFQRAAIAKNDGSLAIIVENTFRRLVNYSLIPLLLLAFIGRDLFVIVFGEVWAEAGVYVQILSIWTFFWFISSPLSTLFSVLEKQELGLRINMVLFFLRLVSLLVGGWIGDARLTISLLALTGILVYGYLSLAIVTEAGVPLAHTLRIFGINLLIFIPLGGALLLMKVAHVDAIIQLIFAALFLVGYVIYLFRSDPELSKIFSGQRI